MELIQYTSEWVKGEVNQGKILIILGVILLIASVFIFKGTNDILRGMLIPFGLILLIFLGYGAYQTFGQQSHLTKVTESYKENTKNTIQKEYEFAQKGDKSYTSLKPIWALLIVVSVALYFIVSKDYSKGLAMGLMLLFLTILILDSVMHYRLKTYLKGITEIRLE
ncbi:MAG: hypothetical protein L3J08_02300 [Flavobacteriaceae bacterium]|nr:hypothetical protein [Flavobacteriaceae bacterium]